MYIITFTDVPASIRMGANIDSVATGYGLNDAKHRRSNL